MALGYVYKNNDRMQTGKMKAAVYERYGPPEVVQIRNTEKPVPKENEVLIKVHAATVNRTDCGFRSAEYMVMAEHDAMSTIPSGMSYEEAAPITEGAHYALCDIRAAKIRSKQEILVNGGTGAIGSAAIQLLKYFDADVTAVCDTRNMELVKSLGADEVIDYTRQDFTKMNRKFDVVFDAVGKSSFGKCRPLLKELVASGKYRPLIDRSYPLGRIVDAYRYVEPDKKQGT